MSKRLPREGANGFSKDIRVRPLLVASAGAINWDISLFVAEIAKPGEEAVIERMERVPGGKAANVAVAIARLLGKSAIIGGIGDDEIGRKHIEIFRSEGVITDGLIIFRGAESGQAYILIDRRGENQINTYFGANAMLRAEHVKEIEPLLSRLSFLVLMDTPMDFGRELLKRCSGHCPVLFAPGVRTLREKEQILELTRKADYLVLNEHELRNLFGGAKEAAKRLGTKVIATMGKRGATLYGLDYEVRVNGVDLEAKGLRVVNTVGCGDAFIGAFAAFKALGKDDLEALEMANYAGAYKATRVETRGSPDMESLKRFVELFKG